MKADYSYDSIQQACPIQNEQIRGLLYRPHRQGLMPLVVCSHGFGSSHSRLACYGNALARHGIAAYMIDYRGGSEESISDGRTTDMTVMTEVDDLMAVVAAARNWDFVDADQIVLLGTSQGGFASAIAASRITPPIAALVLIYPAFMLPDDFHREYSTPGEIPETVFYRGKMLVGREYFTALWDYAPYEEAVRYAGPVLILHGTEDDVVPPAYSQRAAKEYPHASVQFIEGAGHGFEGDDLAEAARDVVAFLKKIRMLPGCR